MNNEEILEQEDVIEGEEIEDSDLEQEVQIVEPDINDPSLSKRQRRKLKRRAKLRKKLLNPNDIAFKGPLSYRYLRLIGWLAFALAQALNVMTIIGNFFKYEMVSERWSMILGFVSDLSVPLFLIAAFATILNQKKEYKKILISYGVTYLAIGLGVSLFFGHYLASLLVAAGKAGMEAAVWLGATFGSKVQINVFADLFFLSLFNFFLMYRPKKHFQGKNRKWFRMMIIIPLLFMGFTLLIKILDGLDAIQLPVYAYAFLTTKSPMMHLLFILLSLWLKNRQKLFIRIGATKEQYKHYLTTNRNSLSFSIIVSVIFFIFSLLDFIVLVFMIAFMETASTPELGLAIYEWIDALGIGECSLLFVAIPFIMLFSYTKSHSDSYDMIVPIAGIGITALGVLEVIYRAVLHFLQTSGQ